MFSTYIKNRRIVIAALTVLVMMASCAGEPEGYFGEIQDWRDLNTLLEANENIVLIDVRTQAEYEAGHIPGAILVPHDEILASGLEIGSDRPIILYCRSGNRSGQAFRELENRGYTLIYDFGGINRWQGDLNYGSEP